MFDSSRLVLMGMHVHFFSNGGLYYLDQQVDMPEFLGLLRHMLSPKENKNLEIQLTHQLDFLQF